ncbi:MAG TPA: helix-turn-helix domain-containing protein [Microlunatus sp.]
MTTPDPPPAEPIDLADLAARVRRLEERLDSRPAGPPEPADHEADTFWILEGLEQRVGPRAVAYAGSFALDGGPVRWQLTRDSDQLMELDWTSLAPALSALGHPARLRILQLIARGQATTAADLSDTPGLGSTGQIYHHLRQLVAAGWLRATTRGRHEVPPERLVPLLVVLSASIP